MDDRSTSNQSSLGQLQRIPRTGRHLLVLAFVASLFLATQSSANAQSNWIWSPRQDGENSSYSDCYFRKKFTLVQPQKSELYIAAGDKYELYINGQLVSKRDSYGTQQKLDVTNLLVSGVNLIAAKVTHFEGDTVGLAIRLRVLEAGESRWRSLYTDETWKTRLQPVPEWYTSSLTDMGWLKAKPSSPAAVVNVDQSSDVVGRSQPTKVAIQNSTPQTSNPKIATEISQIKMTKSAPDNQLAENRFKLPPNFSIEKVVSEDEAGSLIAMTFNEFGKLILSVEGGPLMMADISKAPGDPTRIRTICDKVNTCQGILPLNGSIFVTGMGPDGLALYQLLDNNRDGDFETTKTMLRFTGNIGEHGPHGLSLGNDGMIYVVIGNASQVHEPAQSTSPYLHAYEGDLVPRYEDPGGHAAGVKSPGGTVVRMSVDGKTIQRVAGGLRNAYDLVFDSHGELIVHDSDMESDIGLSWYRPTSVYHVHDGAEFGWRSGWAKFPSYFLDQTPAVSLTDRGSPSGAILYQHLQFPAKYHDTVFLADWSEGRILALRQQPEGAGFTATTEVFLSGKPLNVVDLDVGEDGALYFCTGGRGTEGGVYRIVWNGQIPESLLTFKNDLARVIRHPQPNSAWARQNISKLRQKIGDKWASSMRGIVSEPGNISKFRTRALDNLVMYGPTPDDQLLTSLVTDEDYQVRTKIAQICGLQNSAPHQELLSKLITDDHPRVRRAACESMIRIEQQATFAELEPVLRSTDRIESAVARRLLERIPADQWAEQVFATEDKQIFINGSLAMMISNPSLDRAYQVLARASEIMDGYISDREFVDLLRVVQLALVRGKVNADEIPAFAQRMNSEFPSGNGIINRELSRILAFLKAGSFDGRLEEYLITSPDSEMDKTHVAMYLQTIGDNLESNEKLSLIDYLEKAHSGEGGGGYAFYVERAVQDLTRTLGATETTEVLRNAYKWPIAMLATFQKIPETLDEETVQLIIDSDQQAITSKDPKVVQMRLGIVAILARSGDQLSMDYLRKLWREEADRRGDISIGLAQQPSGENWAYLISSLPVLDDKTSDEVLTKLVSVNRRPRDATHFRQVILLGYRLRADGASKAVKLLEHWSGDTISTSSADWKDMMNQSKSWFEAKWPEESTISIEQEPTKGRYSTEQILSFIESNRQLNPTHGLAVFNEAQCAKCHRHGNIGLASGPDLTSLASRFSKREIAESIVHPSKVVSDQYQAKTVLTVAGETITGLAIKEGGGAYSIVKQDGERVRISADEIDDIKNSELSAMPANLLDELSLQDIADLFAFLEKGTQSRVARTNQDQPK